MSTVAFGMGLDCPCIESYSGDHHLTWKVISKRQDRQEGMEIPPM